MTKKLFWLLVIVALLQSLLCRMNAATPGTVVAWGDNRYGQTNVPVGLSGVTAIATGIGHTVVLKNDGTVVAWGAGTTSTGTFPELGQSIVPVGLGGVRAIAAGDAHTVALKNDGTVVAWGENFAGKTNVPVGLNGVTAIAAGGDHTLALKNDGTVVAWGRNDYGQATVPVGLSGVTAIAGGDLHSVVLKTDGTVVTWGVHGFGRVLAAVPAGLVGVVAVAGGHDHSVALKNDGTVVAWAGGTGYLVNYVPASLGGVTAITANFHTVALKNDGTVVAWGLNDYGQTNVPVGLSRVTAIAAGAGHTVALVAPAIYSFGNLKFYAGMTLDGSVGQQFRVDYADVLGGVTNWLTLSNITLPYSPFLVIDPASPGRTNRFYRAVPLP